MRGVRVGETAAALVQNGCLRVPVAQTFTFAHAADAHRRTGTSAASSYSSPADATSADDGRILSFAVVAAEESRRATDQNSGRVPAAPILAQRLSSAGLLLVVRSLTLRWAA